MLYKRFGHSSQTYAFTPSCRSMCCLRPPLRANFFRQMWQVNQVPSLCDISRCELSCSSLPNSSEQCLHENGFAPVWTRTWLFTSLTVINCFPQKEHKCELTSLCLRCSCFCKLLDWLKHLSHTEHLCGLSPVWTLMWTVSSPDRLNAFSHTRHLYGFSPVWILLWSVRCPAILNRLPQTEHWNGFSPEWLRLCTDNSPFPRQHFPHSLHLYLLQWLFICCVKHTLVAKHFWHLLHEYTLWPARRLLPTLKRRRLANCPSHTVRTGDLGFLFCRCLLMSTSDRFVLQLSPTHYIAQYTDFFTNVRH